MKGLTIFETCLFMQLLKTTKPTSCYVRDRPPKRWLTFWPLLRWAPGSMPEQLIPGTWYAKGRYYSLQGPDQTPACVCSWPPASASIWATEGFSSESGGFWISTATNNAACWHVHPRSSEHAPSWLSGLRENTKKPDGWEVDPLTVLSHTTLWVAFQLLSDSS